MLGETLYGGQDLTELIDLVKNRDSSLNAKNRSYIWSRLLGLDRYDEDSSFDYRELIDWSHADLCQIELDVNRSMWYLIRDEKNGDTDTNGTSSEEEDEDLNEYYYEERLSKKRRQVVNIIMALLSQHPYLHYNQGFHDIVIVILRLIQDDGTMDGDNYLYRVVESVAIKYLQDYMRLDYLALKSIMPQVIKIVRQDDYELYSGFEKVELSPFFLTSWITTLFSHEIEDMEIIGSVFDILISSPTHYILYYCAAYLMVIREDILKVTQNCESIDDSGYLHSFLMKSVSTVPFDAYAIAKQADLLLARVPVTLLVQSSPTLTRQIWRGEVAMFNESLGYGSLTSSSSKLGNCAASDWARLESLYNNQVTGCTPPLMARLSFYTRHIHNLWNILFLALMDLIDVLLIIDAREWEEDLYEEDAQQGKKESVSMLYHTKEYLRHVGRNLRRRASVVKYALGGWGAMLAAVMAVYLNRP